MASFFASPPMISLCDVVPLGVVAVFTSGTELRLTATNLTKGMTEYLRPSPQTIFDALKASAAVPGLHRAVVLDGESYVDGGVTDPLPIQKVLTDGFDEILVVANPRFGTWDTISRRILRLISPRVGKMIQKGDEAFRRLSQILTGGKVRIIKPDQDLLMKNSFDRDRGKVNATFDRGIEDGLKYLKKFGASSLGNMF